MPDIDREAVTGPEKASLAEVLMSIPNAGENADFARDDSIQEMLDAFDPKKHGGEVMK